MPTKPTKLPLRGRGLYCRGCRYPLSGLVSPGTCPECGRAIDFEDRRTFTLDEQPQRQWAMWLLLSACVALLICVTIGGRVAMVWGWNTRWFPQAWVFIVYPIWQFAVAVLTVLTVRILGWLRDIPTTIAVGAAVGTLTGIFDNVALGFLGAGLGAAAGFFVEWVWPR